MRIIATTNQSTYFLNVSEFLAATCRGNTLYLGSEKIQSIEFEDEIEETLIVEKVNWKRDGF